MWVNSAERERSPVEIEKRGSGREKRSSGKRLKNLVCNAWNTSESHFDRIQRFPSVC